VLVLWARTDWSRFDGHELRDVAPCSAVRWPWA
jgi:hypothetical protein